MSAQAANSIEKMLCHQIATVHFSAMRLLEQSANPDLRLPPGEVVRLTNAAARMMDVYQAVCLTLQKLKTHDEQCVLVQYQQVNVGKWWASGGCWQARSERVARPECEDDFRRTGTARKPW